MWQARVRELAHQGLVKIIEACFCRRCADNQVYTDGFRKEQSLEFSIKNVTGRTKTGCTVVGVFNRASSPIASNSISFRRLSRKAREPRRHGARAARHCSCTTGQRAAERVMLVGLGREGEFRAAYRERSLTRYALRMPRARRTWKFIHKPWLSKGAMRNGERSRRCRCNARRSIAFDVMKSRKEAAVSALRSVTLASTRLTCATPKGRRQAPRWLKAGAHEDLGTFRPRVHPVVPR